LRSSLFQQSLMARCDGAAIRPLGSFYSVEGPRDAPVLQPAWASPTIVLEAGSGDDVL